MWSQELDSVLMDPFQLKRMILFSFQTNYFRLLKRFLAGFCNTFTLEIKHKIILFKKNL